MIFVGTFRVVVSTETEVEAAVAMESLSIKMQEHLDPDPELSEDIRLTELVPADTASTPEELITYMRVMRNRLLRTKGSMAFDIAKQLDLLAWTYEKNVVPNDIQPSYDYANILDVAQLVWAGRNPVNR